MNVLLILGLLLFHFIGDFTRLNTSEMLQAKLNKGSYLPIIKHAVVHGLLSLCFLAFFSLSFWQYVVVFLLISVTHFFIDYGKGRLNIKYPFLSKPSHELYWIVFGADQYLHIAIIVLVSHYIL